MPRGIPKNPRKPRDKSRGSKLSVEWSSKHGFQAFGNRLNFLSPEAQHLSDGRLRILPPLGEKTRTRE